MKIPKFLSKIEVNALIVIAEWIIIAFWTLWIGRDYLDMSLNMWPNNGQEYIMSMQNQYVWNLLPKCGACIFWNGFTNGGQPSFIDTLSGWLHPISILATFIFGVFTSGKIIVLASLFMAGIGQWWFGKILNLRPIVRTWLAMIFVASGCLAGRMEIGSPPLIQGMAACSLVLPATLELGLHGGKRATILFGIALGLAAIAGQGYPQSGLIFCLIPMVLALILEIRPNGLVKFKPVWRNFIIATVLGGLVAAPFIIPFINNFSYITKSVDPNFTSTQPLKYLVLNLVIDDGPFFNTTALGKLPYPVLNVNFIGWIPVIFAVIGLFTAPRKYRRAIVGICVGISFVLLTSSGVLLKLIYQIPFGQIVSWIRGPGQFQGLAGGLILGLAGLGIESLLAKEWPQFTFSFLKTNQKFGIVNLNLKWLIMLVLLFLSLKSVSDFSKIYLFSVKNTQDTNYLLSPLTTPDAQWVQPPQGEYIWLPAAMELGMKINYFFKPWSITGTEMPRAYLEMANSKEDADAPYYVNDFEGYTILKRPQNFYAYVTSGNNITPCIATSKGGNIDVNCDTQSAGTLTVVERDLNGWNAKHDGQKVSLQPGMWLTTDAPAGKHQYSFRYRPWDAPLGISFSIIGWLCAIAGLVYFSIKREDQPGEPIQNTAVSVSEYGNDI